MQTTTKITKAHYNAVAGQVNRLLKKWHGQGVKPRISVLERGTDGTVLILNEDAMDLLQYDGQLENLLYTGEVFVVGDNDFYLEPYDSKMTFKLAV